MIQDEDYLLRQIRAAIVTILEILRGRTEQRALDEALVSAFGLDLSTLDSLSAGSLAMLLTPGDRRGAQRLEGIASVLEALAERAPEDPRSEGRRRKAAAIRGMLAGSATGDD